MHTTAWPSSGTFVVRSDCKALDLPPELIHCEVRPHSEGFWVYSPSASTTLAVLAWVIAEVTTEVLVELGERGCEACPVAPPFTSTVCCNECFVSWCFWRVFEDILYCNEYPPRLPCSHRLENI
jgi:hypothetical protein